MFHSYTWKRGGGKDRSVNVVKKIFMNLILISHNLHQIRRTFPFDGIYTNPRLSNIQLHDQISDFLLTHLLIFPVTLLFEHHVGALSGKIQLEKSCSNLFKCLQKIHFEKFYPCACPYARANCQRSKNTHKKMCFDFHFFMSNFDINSVLQLQKYSEMHENWYLWIINLYQNELLKLQIK